MSSTEYCVPPSLLFSDLSTSFALRNLSNNLSYFFVPTFAPSPPTVAIIFGWASILSGILMLLSLAALRMICSASATRLLAHSHTTDSGSNLHVSSKISPLANVILKCINYHTMNCYLTFHFDRKTTNKSTFVFHFSIHVNSIFKYGFIPQYYNKLKRSFFSQCINRPSSTCMPCIQQ